MSLPSASERAFGLIRSRRIVRSGQSLRVAAASTLAFALVLGAASAAHAFELELKLGLLNRFTMRRNAVERFLRYSPTQRAYDTGAFINPRRDDTYYSFVANAGVYLGVTRWLGFGVSVDSGELRPHGRLPATTTVTMPDSIAQRFGEPVVMSTARAKPRWTCQPWNSGLIQRWGSSPRPATRRPISM